MGKKYEIKKGLLFVDGKQVPFKTSPNVGGKCTPEILVCHDTASGLNSSGPISWLTNPDAKASAHFVLGRDGDITQLVSTDRAAWHAGKSEYNERSVGGSVNSFAVGIEIVNPGIMTDLSSDGKTAYFSNGKKNVGWNIAEYGIKKAKPLPLTLKRAEAWWMSYTDAQIEGVIGIGQAIKDAYNIKDVVAHWTVSPGRKVDTNPLFPLEEVKEAILKGTTMAKAPTVVVKQNASTEEKESAAKSAMSKSTETTKVVQVKEEGAKPKANEDVSPPSPKADTPLASVAASKTAHKEVEEIDESVAPIQAPVDNTPVAPDPTTPAEKDILKGKGKAAEKQEAINTLSKALVKQNLNMRQWPDSPTIVGVLRVGAYVDIVRESSSQTTGSKWYFVRALPAAMQGVVDKAKVYEGYVHSAFVEMAPKL